MRRTILVTLLLGALIAAPAGAGAREDARAQSANYVSNGFFVGGHGNLIGQNHHMTVPEDSTPIVFEPAPGDRFVRLQIEDATGRPSVVLVHQDIPQAHHVDDIEFCAPAQYIELRSSAPVEVRLFSGVCHNHKYGVATTGTIRATFSR